MKFRPDMIDAILNGTKTQTRRPTKGKQCPHKVGDVIILDPKLDDKIQITAIREEALYDITEADALAEGMTFDRYGVGNIPESFACAARYQFCRLWNMIYGGSQYSILRDPQVWVYTFVKL